MALRPIAGGRVHDIPFGGASGPTPPDPQKLRGLLGGGQQQQQPPQFEGLLGGAQQQPQPVMQQPQSLPPDQQRFMDIMTAAGVPAERFTGSPPAGLADAYRSGANLPQNDLMRMAQWGATGYWPGGMGEIYKQSQNAGGDQSGVGGAGGGAPTGSLEQRFPHSAGKHPLSPFEPIPAGLPYQQGRDIISTGGLPQGRKGSEPSQHLQAMEWLRSKIATIGK